MSQHERAPSVLSTEAVRAQLQRVLASDGFARCPRMRRFLAFVVEETLAGRQDQIGEYSIGLEVFDRAPDFQPQLDPIVRNDARRLRQKLLEYDRYHPAGEVVIDIPKGGYVPSFLPGSPRRLAAVSAPSPRRVAILPVETLSAGPELKLLATALGLALTAGFTDLAGFEVVGYGYVRPAELSDAATELRITHAIQGVLVHHRDLCRAMINLVELPGATQVWAAEYEADLTDVVATQWSIVASTLREVTSRLAGSPSSSERRLTLVA